MENNSVGPWLDLFDSIPPSPTPSAPEPPPVEPARPATPRTRVTRIDPDLTARQKARTTLDQTIRVALSSAQGAHGVLAAWDPAGDLPHALLASVAARFGLPPPKPRSAAILAGDAVRALKAQGYRVDVAIRGKAWKVYAPHKASGLGEPTGRNELLVSLVSNGLFIEGPEHLAATVREIFAHEQATATLPSGAQTAWLKGICENTFRGVKVPYGYWIPPGQPSDRWREFAPALREAGMLVPSVPASITAIEDINESIADGLIAEVSSALDALQRRIATAPCGALGIRAAANELDELSALRAKLDLYELLTGPLPQPRARIRAMMETLEPMLNSTTQRAFVLEME